MGDPGDTDTGGWLGVISAGRARWSKRGGRGEEESERGGLKKRILEREETGRGDGPTVCLSARSRCPGCSAPAAVRNSHKMAARPRGAERLRREEGRGGRGNWEAEAEAASRGGEGHRPSPEGRRKEPKGESEAEARRKKPRVAERETEGGGKSRR